MILELKKITTWPSFYLPAATAWLFSSRRGKNFFPSVVLWSCTGN